MKDIYFKSMIQYNDIDKLASENTVTNFSEGHWQEELWELLFSSGNWINSILTFLIVLLLTLCHYCLLSPLKFQPTSLSVTMA